MQMWRSNQVNGATRELDHGVPIPRDALCRKIREDKEGEEELSESDVMPTAPYVSLRRRPAFVDWGDQEIGKVVRLACGGLKAGEIAEQLGDPVSAQAVGELLKSCTRGLQERSTVKSPPSKPGKTLMEVFADEEAPPKIGRPRSTTPAQEERVCELRRSGHTIAAIGNETGLTDGQVRWLVSVLEVDDGHA